MSFEEYRDKWDTYPKEFKQERVPCHIDCELTTKCNLRCIMCRVSYNPIPFEDMPLTMVKAIIDEFAEKGGCSIKFTYLGEPLLYPHLFEVIKYAKDKGITDTMIATNGILLDDYKECIRLIKSGLDFIIFSVDSQYPKTYEKIRVGGDLDKVKRGLINLNIQKQALKSKIPRIQIQAIIMDSNREEIESGEYHRYFESFADTIFITPTCKDYSNKKIIEETPNFFCRSPFRRMTIRVNGDIAVCCGQRLPEKLLGNVNWMSLEEAWNSKKFKNIRKLAKENKLHLVDICKTCPGRLFEVHDIDR